MGTKNLVAVGSPQFELGLERRRIPRPLDLNVLFSKATFHGALMYVIECGNFEEDKEIYLPLGIDAGNWTRIKKGPRTPNGMSFPQEKEEQLQELCGNKGLTLWRAHRDGMGTYDLMQSKDKIIESQAKQINQLESDIEALKRLLFGGRAHG